MTKELFAKHASVLALSLIGAGLATTNAYAQESDEDRWHVSLTPRFQILNYTPHVSGGLSEMSSMPTYGGTFAVTFPDERFTVTANYFYGEDEHNYINRQNIGPATTLQYEVTRSDAYGYLEYTPTDSNVTLMVGARVFDMDFHEENSGVTFISDYNISAWTVEVGGRISGQIWPDSRHSLYAQATGGVGVASYDETTTSVTPISEDYTVTTIEGAVGYNYRATDNLYLGARARLLHFGTWGEERPANQFGERSGAGFGYEFNVTFRF